MAIQAGLRFRYYGLFLSLVTVCPVSIHGQATGITSQIPDAPQVSLMVLARQSATVMPNSGESCSRPVPAPDAVRR